MPLQAVQVAESTSACDRHRLADLMLTSLAAEGTSACLSAGLQLLLEDVSLETLLVIISGPFNSIEELRRVRAVSAVPTMSN